jgi:hypothetical protein
MRRRQLSERALQSVFDSLSGLEDSGDLIDSVGLAGSFWNPSDSFLESVSLRIICGLVVNPGSTIQVTLESSVGGPAPSGITLLSLGSFSEFSASSSQLVMLPAGSFALSGGTRYWIRLTSTDGALCGWSYTQDISGPGVSTEFAFTSSMVVISNAATSSADMMAVVVDSIELGTE